MVNYGKFDYKSAFEEGPWQPLDCCSPNQYSVCTLTGFGATYYPHLLGDFYHDVLFLHGGGFGINFI